MAEVECTEGRYEAHHGEFGKVYRWCPECLLVKCDCGEMTTLDDTDTTCVWCGADHTSIVQEELVPLWLEDEAVHPDAIREHAKKAGSLLALLGLV
jgi:hypothetical protein